MNPLGIQFFNSFRIIDGRRQRYGRVGRGDDGSLWLEKSFLGISEDELSEMYAQDRRSMLLNQTDGRWYVNAQAILKWLIPPEGQKAVAAFHDELLDRLHPTNFRK